MFVTVSLKLAGLFPLAATVRSAVGADS